MVLKKIEPDSSYRSTVKGCVATDTQCNKGNSDWIEGKTCSHRD